MDKNLNSSPPLDAMTTIGGEGERISFLENRGREYLVLHDIWMLPVSLAI
jgi:hypothetical protein